MAELFNIIFTTGFGYSVLRVTTPILFAALGALISDRAGVINIALEGIMLTSALAGVIISATTQSAWIGLLGAVLVGALVGLLLAYFSLNLKTDIILSGIALNLMAAGGTVFVLFLVVNNKGISSDLKSKVIPNIDIPLIDKIPIIGPIFSGHNALTYISILSVIFIYYLLYKTPLGLKIRAVGENPNAADSVGISVRKIKYIALILSGVFAGFGGAYMSMGYLSYFTRNMTAGRGFIALAAEAMGGATPIGTFLTSLFFGFADALANNLQTLRVPPQFIYMIPYIATLIGLVIYASRKQSQIKRIKKQKIKQL
ncbi:ABC transporter permease [Vallitalea sp.]|jgi:simple sugar transport system permease protein|uniref:ABC transporter permease n=1 Tax=Vallitalea sp. TaxID=1882829 RepID=UPI0025E97954|nr:ABC transporter permease [Vallitalea sp.]MCT4688571.1 ABC transporter permease [Vallitalea sp.]